VLGLEALCRWTHEGEAIAPLEFIALAERSGQISGLGRNVLAATCRSLQGLRKRHPALRCSVNLSVGQFVDGNIEADVVAAVSAADLPMSALRLEITESLVATHESGIVPAMRRLVELGAEFCLDDFGTGFSSLDRLRQLPIRTLKIDRSFVTPLAQGDDVMVRHIHTLSHDLGLDTIAEGVEQEEERRRLCEIGCFAMQGYLLARPMPASELARWLEHRVVRGH
jgi:EAL domain-containing protein (putative c-di-GMP-specific phosphodiesterase class I)